MVGGTVVVYHLVADSTVLVVTTSHAASVDTRGFRYLGRNSNGRGRCVTAGFGGGSI